MRILDRYLARQLILPFLIGVLTFVVILVGDEARKLGEMLGGTVSPVLIVKYLYYNAPQALVWSLPVGTLVGVAMAVTTLSRNGEAVAVRTGGASFARMCAPFVGFSVVATVAAFWLTESVVPPAMQRAHAVFREMTFSQPVIRAERDVFFRDDRGRIFYIRQMNADSNELRDITIWTLDEQGHPQTVTAAKCATLNGRQWLLQEGATVRLGPDGQFTGEISRFDSQEIVLWKALQDYYAESRTPYEMSTRELDRLVRTVEETGGRPHEFKTQLHFKYSIPVACVVFALLAAPLADRFAQRGAFVGILIAVLIVFLYNGVRSWGLAFGMAGAMNPVLAAWAQNIIFGGLGIVLMWRHR